MTTLDEIGARAGRAARVFGAELATTMDTCDVIMAAATSARRDRRRARARLIGIGVAVGAVAVVVTLVQVVGRDGRRIEPIAPVLPTQPAASVPTPSADSTTPTSQPEPATAESTTVSPTTSTPAVDDGPTAALSLTHPVIDLAGCTRTWARSSRVGKPIDRPFARSSSKPISFQVFGASNGSLLQPFVMAERLFANQRLSPDSVTDRQINGRPAYVEAPVGGSGIVLWLLPDGSEGYLRTRSMTEAQLLQLAAVLLPRPADAAVLGFDLPVGAEPSLSILDENYGPFSPGPSASSGCDPANAASVSVTLLQSRPLVDAVWILDRSSQDAIALRELGDDGLLLVGGPGLVDTSIADAALATVREATTEEWNAMLYYPRIWELIQPGFPIDQQLADALDGTTFPTPEAIPGIVIPLLQQQLGDTNLDVQAVNNVHYYEWVFTVPVTGQHFIARQWSVSYDVDGTGGYATYQVHTGIKCSDGTVQPTDNLCEPSS